MIAVPPYASANSFDFAVRARPPAHFYIDLGNLCNLRCPFCVTGAKQTTQSTGFMRLQEYLVILERIRQAAKLICLYNWGEPLLNPDLVSIIRATTDAGIRTHIDSNLTSKLLTTAEAETLVGSGLSSLFASADGASQEAYAKYRVRGRYDRVIQNLALLVETKRRLQSTTPFLGWQYHVHRFNEADMEPARVKSEELGVPIVFKRLSTPDPNWKSSYHDEEGMFVSGTAWFNQVYNPPGNPDMRRVAFHPQVLSPCHQLFETMVVEWNGDVYPCTVVSSPHHVMGNLLRQSLDEVWNGLLFQRSRKFILNFGPHQGGKSICENNACAMVRKCAG